MRRFTVLLIITTLLCVSSVPTTVEACICKLGNLEHHHHYTLEYARHQHVTAKSHDVFHACCIECGCNCHHNFDSLPHLLAPYAIGITVFGPGVLSHRIMDRVETFELLGPPHILLPPPESTKTTA